MLPTISLGPLVLPTAGLVYLAGIWLALSLVERAGARLRLDVAATYGVAAAGLLGGVVGARLLFVVLHWSAYEQNLLGILWPPTSGFDLFGGLVIGAAAAFFYGRYRNLPPAATLDALLPGLMGALISVSLADFLAGPGYGTETTVFWGINQFGIRRHPVQLYEIFFALSALATWWMVTRRQVENGRPFLMATAVYSAGRLFVDAFRANAWITTGGWHSLQIVALGVLLVALFLLGRQGEEETVEAV